MVEETKLFDVAGEVESGWFHLDSRRSVVCAGGALWIDGKNVGAFADVREVRFSADGQRLAFVHEVDDRSALVVDGERVAEHRFICRSTLAMTADGKSVGYTFWDGDDYWVQKDDRVFGPYSDQQPGAGWNTRPLVFDATGALYYAAKRGDRWALDRDGEPLTDDWQLVRDPESAGDRVWAKARRDDAWYVIGSAGGEPFGPFDKLREFALSPDATRLGFGAFDGEGPLVHCDGRVVARPAEDVGLHAAFAGDALAYQEELEDGDERVVVGDRPLRSWGGVRGLVGNAAGNVGYVGVGEGYREYACVDDKAYGGHKNIYHLGLALSAGGRIAYVIPETPDRVAIDDSEGPAYDGIRTRPEFLDEDHVHYIARRGTAFLHVRQRA